MPRIDDPKSKLKMDKVKPFVKENLRPWNVMESISNRDQTGNVIDNKQVTNWEQIDTKSITSEPVIDNKPVTNRKQTGNVIDINSITEFNFTLLSGLQKKIMLFIANECKKAGGFQTKIIPRITIALSVESPEGSVKTTIRRLEKKKVLRVLEAKAGRGGWSKYEMPEPIFREVLKHEFDNVIDNKPVTLSITSNTYSSSNINKTTTTELPDDWKEIDIVPLEHIGFSIEHVRQLLKCSNPEIVQSSVNHFAFALEHNEKIKAHTSPLNLFMGVLRKGGNWIEGNYESPQDKALRQILEQRRAEQARRAAMEKELQDLAFEEWYASLSDAQKSSIVPRGTVRLPEQALKASCREYFINEVYKK
jgi:hypothetical protein